MGQEIVYCSVCQTRLVAAEFEKGKALWVDHRACCKGCVPGMLDSLPPEKRQVLAGDVHLTPPLPPESPKRGTERIGKVLSSESPKRGTERIAKPPTARAVVETGVSPLAIVGGIVGVLVLGAVVLSISSTPAERRSSSSPTRSSDPAPSRPIAPDPPPPPPPNREEKAAALSLQKAREFVKASPDKVDEALALYEGAVWDARGTGMLEEAKREFEALQHRQGDLLQSELAPVLQEARAAKGREEFGKALEVLEKALPRRPWRDWSAALQREIRGVRDQADQAYGDLKDRAVQARRLGDQPVATAAVERVRAWGLKELAADLETTLASIKPAPVASPEAKAYREAWEKAVRLAGGRSYADATRELEAAVKRIKDSALRAEAASDLDAVKAAGRVPSDALQALSRTPVGQKLSLEIEDASGTPVKVDGVLSRASAAAIDLRTETGTIQVDLAELSAASLVEVYRGRAGADARAIAAFLILEGEEGTPAPADPVLARLHAEALRSASASAREKEGAARALYLRAEREFEGLETRLASAESFSALLSQHGETRLVLRRRAEIAARLEAAKDAGKDYVFFPGEMRLGGLFQTVTHKKGEVAATLQSDQPAIKDHYVEVAFTALPGAEYKGWALLGACCAETYAHACQGTELTGPSPTGEKVAAEPDSGQWVAGKVPTVFLKRLHSQHGGPKAPARWEWVALPVPKYAAGGKKVLRILSGQQGFAVRAVAIGVSRVAPPGEAEFREVEKARLSVLLKPAPARDPSLVAHWKFDDGSGTVAVDSSGNGLNGTLRNGPTWTTGRIGGALSFNGVNQYVEIGSSPKLTFAGGYTISLWVSLNDVGGDKYHYFLGDYTTKGDMCSLALRAFKDGHAQFFWEYPAGTWSTVASRGVLPVGRWIHLAGTWDGATRRLYLNGALEAADAKPQQRPPSMNYLTIGRCGGFDGLYTAGEIDDVRLYSRALTDAEVQALVRAAPRK